MFRPAPFRFFLFALVVSFPGIPRSVAAQDPIRVQSSQVLVPVVVQDKRLLAPRRNGRVTKKEFDQEYAQLLDGTSLGDFRLFEDGKRQVIQSVTLQHAALSVVRDSFGRHPEITGSGGGYWAYPDRSFSDPHIWLPFPEYVIAYVPQPSAEGSCHQIRVTVDHPHLIAYSRTEYCNVKHPPSDPLLGTEFGNQMQDALLSNKEAKIDLRLQTVVFYNDVATTRLYLGLEFPWASLKHELRNRTLYATIGLVGMIFRKDGTVATRFSDFACCDNNSSGQLPARARPDQEDSSQASALLPNRYSTIVDLPPGEYTARVVLSDGEKFGQASVPLVIADHGGQPLFISQPFLSLRLRNLVVASPPNLAESDSPFLSRDVVFTPESRSRYKNGELVNVFFQLYDAQILAQPPPTIQVHMRIVSVENGASIADFDPVDAAPYARPGVAVISIARGIKLNHLPVGSYHFEVQATDSTGKNTEWSAASFAIEPGEVRRPADLPALPDAQNP